MSRGTVDVPAGELASNVLRTAGWTVLGSAPGLMLPLLVAAREPDRAVTDAYFFAVESTLFAATVFTVVMKGVLVPFFVEWVRAAVPALYRRTVLMSALAAGAATAAYAVAAAALLWGVLPHTELSAAQRSDVAALLVALAPLPGAMAWSSVTAAAHYSVERWGLASWSEGLRSLVPLILVALGLFDGRLLAIAVALWVGELIRLVALDRSWRRIAAGGEPGQVRVRDLVPVWRVAAPQLLSMVVVNANPIVDKAFAATLPRGSVTTLTLAEKLFYVPQMLFGSALALVFGTRWARMAIAERSSRLREDFMRTQVAVGAGALVVSVVVCALAFPLAGAVGRLLHVDGATFVSTFQLFALGLAPALSAALSLRLFLAAKATSLLPLFAVVLLAVNVVADYAGARWIGVQGIALASTLVRCVSAALYLLFVARVLTRVRRAVALAGGV